MSKKQTLSEEAKSGLKELFNTLVINDFKEINKSVANEIKDDLNSVKIQIVSGMKDPIENLSEDVISKINSSHEEVNSSIEILSDEFEDIINEKNIICEDVFVNESSKVKDSLLTIEKLVENKYSLLSDTVLNELKNISSNIDENYSAKMNKIESKSLEIITNVNEKFDELNDVGKELNNKYINISKENSINIKEGILENINKIDELKGYIEELETKNEANIQELEKRYNDKIDYIESSIFNSNNETLEKLENGLSKLSEDNIEKDKVIKKLLIINTILSLIMIIGIGIVLFK